jgi:hypothetical protein
MTMKKQLLIMAMAMATMTASAQVVLWDGEDKEVGSDGGFWNRAEPTVVEEDGNKCLKITTKDNPGGWDKEHCNAGLPLGDVDFKGLRRMTMRIKMSINHNVLVKLVKDGDGGYSTGRLFWCGDADQWNILTFEFAAGPDNEKISDTGNTVLEIWPFEDGGDALANVGQTIYIDDVKMEGPMVDGKGILALPDNSLTGEVTVTGVIGKGNYQCTWDGDWHPEAYDDYALLAAKLAPTATKLDVSGAGRWDEDWDVIKAKCPGIEIITETSTGIQQTNMYQDATNETYTLTGVRVATPTEKGIYIVGGRKVLVK